jgi:hydrogenase/urease accessory protein HupE
MVFLWPATASAHLVSTGFGPFYDGITHLAMSPDDLLSVLAIAFLSGLLGARYGRVTLFALPLTWLIGGLIGIQFDQEISLPVLNTLSFLIVGILVAADKKLFCNRCACVGLCGFNPEGLGQDSGSGCRKLDYGNRPVDAWLDI